MKYRIPSDSEAIDILTDAESRFCTTERQAIARGRSKAWAEHCANGPSGQLRTLAQGAVGDSILLRGYTASRQISALTASVSVAEGAQFSCALERSLVDASVIGVRVTLVAFTR